MRTIQVRCTFTIPVEVENESEASADEVRHMIKKTPALARVRWGLRSTRSTSRRRSTRPAGRARSEAKTNRGPASRSSPHGLGAVGESARSGPSQRVLALRARPRQALVRALRSGDGELHRRARAQGEGVMAIDLDNPAECDVEETVALLNETITRASNLALQLGRERAKRERLQRELDCQRKRNGSATGSWTRSTTSGAQGVARRACTGTVGPRTLLLRRWCR